MSQFDWQEKLKKIRIDTKPEGLEKPQHGPSTPGQHPKHDNSANRAPVTAEPQKQELGAREAEPLTDQEAFEAAVHAIESQGKAILAKYDRGGSDNARPPAEKAPGLVAQKQEEKRNEGEGSPEEPGVLSATDQNLFLEAVAGANHGTWHRAKTAAAKTDGGLRAREQATIDVDRQVGGPVEVDLFEMPRSQTMEFFKGFLERQARLNKKRLTVRYPPEIRSAVQDTLLQSRWAGDFHDIPGCSPGEERVEVALVQQFA